MLQTFVLSYCCSGTAVALLKWPSWRQEGAWLLTPNTGSRRMAIGTCLGVGKSPPVDVYRFIGVLMNICHARKPIWHPRCRVSDVTSNTGLSDCTCTGHGRGLWKQSSRIWLSCSGNMPFSLAGFASALQLGLPSWFWLGWFWTICFWDFFWCFPFEELSWFQAMEKLTIKTYQNWAAYAQVGGWDPALTAQTQHLTRLRRWSRES